MANKTKKEKLQALKVVDGKLDEAVKTEAPIKPFRSIDELFDFHGAQYKTYNEFEYKEALGSMNKIDLQTECWRVGLSPNDNRNIMIERLMKQFRRVTASIRTADLKPTVIRSTPEIRNILAEGANRVGG